MSDLDTKKKIAYGDFQTPDTLAADVCALLRKFGYQPKSILEPTCGVGSFFVSALQTFPALQYAAAFDIDDTYVQTLKHSLCNASVLPQLKIRVADFFSKNWDKELQGMPEPILIIGNPPWVTNSQLGQINGNNLPDKYNIKKLRGLDAVTGKSNFDISEWMMSRMIESLWGKTGTLSMLCKTSVARKVLMHAWKNDAPLTQVTMHLIDSKYHFGISADVCLLTVSSAQRAEKSCKVYECLFAEQPSQTIGFRDGFLIADMPSYMQSKRLIDSNQCYAWRTGIKHDNAKVMELERVSVGLYQNGFGEIHELEDLCLFPLLKGSCLANGKRPRKYMLVPQRKVGQDTLSLKRLAPKTWSYLSEYAALFDKRKSSIYKNKPRFSIFGVGDYTFTKWKVAIPALYKALSFSVVGPYQNSCVVFDDTVNFIAVDNQQQAKTLSALLNSESAKNFYNSFIFWDSKRPVTAQLLKMLDIDALAREVGMPVLHKHPEHPRRLPLLAQ